MRTLILFNGPPSSGKTTSSEYLLHRYGVRSYSLAFPLRQAAATLFPSIDFFDDSIKDLPVFNGITPRQILIQLSEGFYKKLFGRDYWAWRLSQELNKLPPDAIVSVSDVGFDYEIDALRAATSRLILVRLFRVGTTWEGDSRKRVEVDDLETFDIQALDIEQLKGKLDMMIKALEEVF